MTVLFFAGIAEKVGLRRLEMPLEPGETVAGVRDRLIARYPAMAPFVDNLMYAVDEEYAVPETPLRAGATLALIPPVSGGQ